MIALIQHDGALRAKPLWTAIGFSFGITFAATAVGSWLYWIPLAVYLGATATRRRAGDLDLALPLPARRLWLAHALALGLGGGLVLGCGIGFRALWGLVAAPGSGAEVLAGALRLGAALAIVVAVLESRRPAVASTLTLADDVFLCAVVVVVPGVVLQLEVRWAVALLGLALVLGFRTWRSLPAALTLVPLAAPPAAATGRGAAERGWAAPAGGNRWRHRLGLLRYLSADPVSWGVSFLAGLMAVFLVIMWNDADIGFWVLPISGLLFMITIFVFPLLQMVRLAVLDPLPIRRRVLFAGLILPAAGGLALGCGALASLVGPEDTGLALPLVLLVAGLPWLLLLAIVFRTVKGGIALAGLVILAVFLLPLVIPPAAEGAVDGFLDRLGESPAGTLAAWLSTALLLLGGCVLAAAAALGLAVTYALAEARFRRFEVSAPGGGRTEQVPEREVHHDR